MAKPKAGKDDKKAARRAETERLAAAAAAARAASAAPDLLAGLPPAFHTHARAGLAATLRYYGPGGLPPPLARWALGLTRRHMRALYDACPGWGWSDRKKGAELAAADARFFVAFADGGGAAGGAAAEASGAAAAGPEGEPAAAAAAGAAAAGGAEDPAESAAAAAAALPGAPGPPLGFAHVRFEVDDAGAPAAYLYEIQVEAAAQGRGLGRHLMLAVEAAARRARLAAVTLTVFKGNAAAAALYRRLGYAQAPESPGAGDPGGGDHGYEILTKVFAPRPAGG